MLEFMGLMFCAVLVVGLLFGSAVLVTEVVDHKKELKRLNECRIECWEHIQALEAKSKRK